MRLQDKTALVTGGANGIGKEIARVFLENGARVAICDINGETLAATALEFSALGQVYTYVLDVTNSEDVTNVIAQAQSQMGGIDILVNNAGITSDAQLYKMTEDQFDQVISVNLKGVFNCTKAASPGMIERGSGRIISTASVVGLYGNFGQTNYVASKAGVIGMTKVWARELGRKGITVNAVAPGFIATEMVKKMPENVLATIRDKTPLKRLGTPRDVAYAFLFLASDEAAFVNGAVLSVDGGLVQ